MRKKHKTRGCSSSSNSSKVSSHHMKNILDTLMRTQTRVSTAKNYLCIWRQFNKFLISLDHMPELWENRTSLFIANLVDNGYQSSTVRSYVSGIKNMLIGDGYQWNDNLILISALTRACRLINDHVTTRLPIHCGLLELILFEIQRYFTQRKQPYLECLYKAMFALGYYGLLRISELAVSEHVLKAAHIHLAINKDKLLLVLYSSKMHGVGSRPQKIKIVSNRAEKLG